MNEINSNLALHKQIDQIFSKPGNLANSAHKIGEKLFKAENDYLQAVSNPNATPGEIAKAEIIYKRVMQIYQSFMQVTAAMFDIMRQALSRLSLR